MQAGRQVAVLSEVDRLVAALRAENERLKLSMDMAHERLVSLAIMFIAFTQTEWLARQAAKESEVGMLTVWFEGQLHATQAHATAALQRSQLVEAENRILKERCRREHPLCVLRPASGKRTRARTQKCLHAPTRAHAHTTTDSAWQDRGPYVGSSEHCRYDPAIRPAR
jgi:hypothetical protein